MKFFLVALFATVLCATVVSAGNNEKLACLAKIYKQESTPEAKALFAKGLPKLGQYLDSAYTKCRSISNVEEQKSCKHTVIKNTVGGAAGLYFGGIKASGPSGLSKLSSIFTKVAKECYGISA